MVDLNGESKTLIKEYVSRGLLSRDKIHDLWLATNTDEAISALRLFLDLTPERVDVIWCYVRNVVWKGVLDKDSKLTMFNEYESWFFENLLRHKGLMSYSFALDKLFPSPHLAKVTTHSLVDMGLVDKIVLDTNEVFFLLNLDFYKRCFE